MRLTKNYELYVNGDKITLETMRVSKVPFNRHWPGHQRALDQTELTTFASFVFGGMMKVKIICDFDFERVCVKPASLGILPEVCGREISFDIAKPCQLTVETDGTLGALHLFADPQRAREKLGENDLYFAPGEHNVGRINLKSGQTVYIDSGATVYGEIYGENVENVRIMGRGILDHSKAEPSHIDPNIIDPPRPSPIEIRYSKNVLIEDVIVRDPCFLAVRPICCEDLLIDNIKVLGCWRYNSDGIDLINTRRAVVRNCFVRSFDDSICLKGFHYPFRNEMFYNGKVYDIMEDVLIENCVVFNDWGHALHIGIDLCAKAVRRCTFKNCDIIHATRSCLNVSNVDYAEIHDILYEDIRVEYDDPCMEPMLQESEEAVYPFDPDSKYMPELFVISVYKNMYSGDGLERGKIHDLTFRNIKITAPAMPPSQISGYSEGNGVQRLRFENVTLCGKPIEALQELNVTVGNFVYDLTCK